MKIPILILVLLFISCSSPKSIIIPSDPNEPVYNTPNLNSHDTKRIVEELLSDIFRDIPELTNSKNINVVFNRLKLDRSITQHVPSKIIVAQLETVLSHEKYINLINLEFIKKNNILVHYKINGEIMMNTTEDRVKYKREYNIILRLINEQTGKKMVYFSNSVGKNLPK